MISATPWFERKFDERLEVGTFPTIVERLRGTPARVEEMLASIDPSTLTRRLDGTWSIQENLGHLLDLEPLWFGRLEDLLRGEKNLRVADLTNRTTDEANHNAKPLASLTRDFRGARLRLIARLDLLSEADVLREAVHPRLKTPMRTIDHARFVAEHDDHHLARMRTLARSLGG
jgi:uncharacterized damage-inducible protein DinB